jgi:hypothetical protein
MDNNGNNKRSASTEPIKPNGDGKRQKSTRPYLWFLFRSDCTLENGFSLKCVSIDRRTVEKYKAAHMKEVDTRKGERWEINRASTEGVEECGVGKPALICYYVNGQVLDVEMVVFPSELTEDKTFEDMGREYVLDNLKLRKDATEDELKEAKIGAFEEDNMIYCYEIVELQ